MLDLNSTLKDIFRETPDISEFFEMKGLPSDAGHPGADKLTLKNLLLFKKIDPPVFAAEAAEFIQSRKELLRTGADIATCSLFGRIPCVVQLPVQNRLDEYIGAESLGSTYNIALAEFGVEWINDLMAKADPPVIIGTGIEGFINNPEIMGGTYKDTCPYGLNPDFAGFEDPRGIFRLISGIPLVMVADTNQLNGPLPEGLADLLDERFGNSIVYPDDGHMLNGILMTYIYKTFGEEGLIRFRENVIGGFHPSQMIKVKGIEEKPAVMLMPHVFATIKAKEEGMKVIWPKEGAPIIPLVITAKAELSPEDRKLYDYITGPEIGGIIVGQGMFPSSSPGVDNDLPGKLWWIGWDYLYGVDILSVIERCKKIMLGVRP